MPLPRPRGADDFTAPEFAATERRILDALRGTTAVTTA
ncbi:hypothetical protein M2283_000008 [Streptomyces pseudovenezuelae]|uniref:Uncharacterized protein n=1 Tax=Streptomyces pseudovenezuelae TaxID=67350 RepID=A0ABT6LBI4_9ACTN|nr:hypothetical protein [Streptomyces pseudovenezuelae]